MESNNAENEIPDIGFKWRRAWGWLGLILGSVSIIGSLAGTGSIGVLMLILLSLNALLMILILKFNKYAFLIATVLSLNPIIWIINGIYLKNRWNHPQVNR
jgi:membrane protein YqaA with SNARE-associated domain